MGALRAELTVAGQSLPVRTVHLREAMSEVTEARVVVDSEAPLDLEAMLLAEATLELEHAALWHRRWTLVMARARALEGNRSRTQPRHYDYELELRAPLHKLALRTDVRKFRDQSTEAIVTQVLGELGLRAAFRVAAPTRTHPYCVQYRESCLDFVRRLLEFEGIYFTNDDDGLVVCADRSAASPAVPGDRVFDLVEAAGALADGAPAIHALRRTARVAPGSSVVDDRDWKRPALSLTGRAAAERDHDLEIYEAPAGYRDPGEGARLAVVRLEARRGRARTIEGESDVGDFAPARGITIGESTGPGFAGDHVLVAVEHRFACATSAHAESEPSYGNRFEAVPRAVSFRPPRATPRPTIPGFHTAMVRGPQGEEIHTDQHGRFKPQFHWDRQASGADDGRWLRMVQESASSMALARVGWEVGVGYVDGDPSRPIGISRLVNGAMPPTYAQPASMQVMSIQTPSSPATGGMSELRLDDSAQSMLFYLRAERDLQNVVKQDKSETVAEREWHDVGANLTRLVEKNQRVQVGVDATTAVGAGARLAVEGCRSRAVGTDEAVSIGKDASTTVAGTETETVGVTRSTKAGGSINLAAQLLRTRIVGGSYVTTTTSGIGASAKYGYAEIVGGAKVSVAALGDISEEIGKGLKVAVGGAVLRTSLGPIALKAKSTTHTAGVVALRSGDKISLEAPNVTLSAGLCAALEAGSLAIELTPGAFKVKGRMELQAKAKIVVTGKVNITKG